MSIANEYTLPRHQNSAVKMINEEDADWNALNRLINIVGNFTPFDRRTGNIGDFPKAVFRITMNDTAPVFPSSSSCKCLENRIAGIVNPQVYTANNAGNTTAPYAYMKSPIAGSNRPGGAVFIPSENRSRKRSYVDVITWANTFPNPAAANTTQLTIHPEQQFLYWLGLQKAKDPHFTERIKKIDMRLAYLPCETCSHAITHKLTRLVGPQPNINIRIHNKRKGTAIPPVINLLNRHPSITAKSIPLATTNPVVRNNVLRAIASRQKKQNDKAPGLIIVNTTVNKTPGNRITTPPVKAGIHQGIAKRKIKQYAANTPAPATRVNGVSKAGFSNAGLKNKVQKAINERKMKQSIASAPTSISAKPAAVQIAREE